MLKMIARTANRTCAETFDTLQVILGTICWVIGFLANPRQKMHKRFEKLGVGGRRD